MKNSKVQSDNARKLTALSQWKEELPSRSKQKESPGKKDKKASSSQQILPKPPSH